MTDKNDSFREKYLAARGCRTELPFLEELKKSYTVTLRVPEILLPLTARDNFSQPLLGLMLDLGPDAFQIEPLNKHSCKPGDWVYFSLAQGVFMCKVDGYNIWCVNDESILSVLEEPPFFIDERDYVPRADGERPRIFFHA